MKKIIFCLLVFSSSIQLFSQTNHVELYQQAMQKFLSNECLSFNMSAIKYADLEGNTMLEQVDFNVIKKGINWYLQTGDYEMIIGQRQMVTIDNAVNDIHLEEKGGIVAADIFSNLTGLETILDYLKLEGDIQVLQNGNTQIDFSAEGNNRTKIELEFNPLNSIVYRSSAVIDMTDYDEIDHAMDGMKIETLYRNVNNKVCVFNDTTAEIIASEFAVLLDKNSFNNYTVK